MSVAAVAALQSQSRAVAGAYGKLNAVGAALLQRRESPGAAEEPSRDRSSRASFAQPGIKKICVTSGFCILARAGLAKGILLQVLKYFFSFR